MYFQGMCDKAAVCYCGEDRNKKETRQKNQIILKVSFLFNVIAVWGFFPVRWCHYRFSSVLRINGLRFLRCGGPRERLGMARGCNLTRTRYLFGLFFKGRGVSVRFLACRRVSSLRVSSSPSVVGSPVGDSRVSAMGTGIGDEFDVVTGVVGVSADEDGRTENGTGIGVVTGAVVGDVVVIVSGDDVICEKNIKEGGVGAKNEVVRSRLRGEP